MNANNRLRVIVALGLVTMVGAAQASGDAAKGKRKAAACGACHGVDGNSVNPIWPKLAGQHKAYLVAQLKAFKSGARKNPMMSPQAAALSEDDMEDISAYFAAQKPNREKLSGLECLDG